MRNRRSRNETDVQARIMRECCRGDTRLFRNNVGQGWVGESTRFGERTTVTVNPGDVVIRRARPLHAGLIAGSGDLIGRHTMTITAAMVGRTVAVFTSVEVKDEDGVVEPDQTTWHQNTVAAGGISVIARSPEDVAAALSDFTGID